MLRLLLAFSFGFVIYMRVAFVDVIAPVGGLDGMVGLVFQVVFGVIFAGIAMAVIAICGVPFWFGPGKRFWFILRALAVVALVGGVVGLSYTFTHLVTLPHPEDYMAAAGATYETYDLTFGWQSWLALMFGIAHFPVPNILEPVL